MKVNRAKRFKVSMPMDKAKKFIEAAAAAMVLEMSVTHGQEGPSQDRIRTVLHPAYEVAADMLSFALGVMVKPDECCSLHCTLYTTYGYMEISVVRVSNGNRQTYNVTAYPEDGLSLVDRRVRASRDNPSEVIERDLNAL